MKINYKTLIRKSVVVVVFLAVILWLLFSIYQKLGLNNLSKEDLQAYIEDKGALAPIIFILITFLQVTLIPIPSTITVLVGTYIFSFWEAFIYSFIGMMLGSLLAFYLGRWFGRPFINWIVGDKRIVDKYLKKIKGKENVLLFFMFLFPFFPDDLLCLIAGVLTISSISFTVMQIITRSVSILVTELMLSGIMIPYDSWGFPVIIIFCLIFLLIFFVVYKYSGRISIYITKKKEVLLKKNDKSK